MAKTIRLYAGGRIKNSVFQASWEAYARRIRHWSLETIEWTDKQFETMQPAKGELWIALDERGSSLTSAHFSEKLTQWIEGPQIPCFLIGPSTGLPPSMLRCAAFSISFSPMTWPHLMARVLWIEQIYRAQQRTLHHPYSFV